MNKKLLIVMLVVSMLVAFTACEGANAYIGHWTINEITAGEITMTADDMADMGLDGGFVKLQKSGAAVVNLLGDEYEGTWALAEDETSATVTYGDEMVGTLVLDDEGKVMTFNDAQGTTYLMERF